MPEGDTIHLARQRLQPVLEHSVVRRFWAGKLRGRRPRSGQTITAVRAHGKHLLIDFANNLTLQVHLGVAGWWTAHPDLGDDDETFQRFRRNPRLRLYIATDQGVATCYSAPTIQTFVRTDEPTDLTPLTNLGPDLCVDEDQRGQVAEEALTRLRQRLSPDDLVADALLDQTVAAGVGNVYKSETLFLERLQPFAPIGELSDDVVLALFTTASRLLWRNTQTPAEPRTTTPHRLAAARSQGRVFVYQRHRAPCRRCQTPVERSYQGRYGRSTYWCPRCQPDERPASLPTEGPEPGKEQL